MTEEPHAVLGVDDTIDSADNLAESSGVRRGWSVGTPRLEGTVDAGSLPCDGRAAAARGLFRN